MTINISAVNSMSMRVLSFWSVSITGTCAFFCLWVKRKIHSIFLFFTGARVFNHVNNIVFDSISTGSNHRQNSSFLGISLYVYILISLFFYFFCVRCFLFWSFYAIYWKNVHFVNIIDPYFPFPVLCPYMVMGIPLFWTSHIFFAWYRFYLLWNWIR